MNGGLYRPYPEACPGSIFYAAGAKFQHGSESAVDVYINSTKVSNHTGSGPDEAPYEKLAIGPDRGNDCTFYGCNAAGPGCGTWALPYPTNEWTKLPNKQRYPVCHKTGFKNALYVRSWHGRFKFDSFEGGDAFSVLVGCGPSHPERIVKYQEAQPVDRVHYLTNSAVITFDHNDLILPANSETDTVSLSASVAEMTGLVSYTGSLTPNTQRNQALPFVHIANWTLGDIQARMFTMITQAEYGDYDYTGNVLTHFDTHGRVQEQVIFYGAGSWHRELRGYNFPYNPSDPAFVTYTEDVEADGVTLTYTSVTENWDTHFANHLSTDTVTVAATLSDELADSDVRDDGCNNLLVLWPLDNDVLYAWRTDGHLSTGPLVARNEMTLTVQPILGNNLIPDYDVRDIPSYYDPPDYGLYWGLMLAGDTNSSTTVVDINFGYLYGGEDFGTLTSPAYTAAGRLAIPNAYSITRGALPPGISFDTNTGAIYGTVSALTTPDYYGVDVEVNGTALYDGSIIGAPTSTTAYKPNCFDFSFNDVKGCLYTNQETEQITFMSWVYGYGMNVSTYNASLTDGQLPVNATHWPQNLAIWEKGGGAWEAYNEQVTANIFGSDIHSGDGRIWGQKWAEILDTWPSQNMARPAGADKFTYLERDTNSPVVGVSALAGGISGDDFSGAIFTAIDYMGNPTTITDASGVWGGPVVKGFYPITVTGSLVTLGTKLYNMPSNWASASGDDAICFGRLRFPNCPSLLGRVEISAGTLGTTFAFGAAQPTFGMAVAGTESVDLFDAAMTLLSTQTATRTDDAHFTVPVAAHGAVWALIHGNPNPWYMNVNYPRGNFAALEFLWDFRTNKQVAALTGQLDCTEAQVMMPTANNQFASFSQTPHCLPFTPCSPRVVCFSPNAEDFPNGITIPFPDDFTFDTTYGSKWQGVVQGAMTDLLAQTPHQPLAGIDPVTEDPIDDGSNIILTQDDGSCHEDSTDYDTGATTVYYPHAAQVECILSAPSNYGMGQNETPNIAALTAAGIVIGWLSPVNNTGANVAYPPQYGNGHYFIGFNSDGTPASVDTPWALHQRLCNLPELCRFKTVYQDEIAGCQ